LPPSDADIGAELHGWARDLFPICRSLTGPGVRETLAYIKNILPDLQIHSVPTGTKAFDWTVPDEWTIRDAYIADEAGNRVVDFRKNNLHVVGYSEPVDRTLDLSELQGYLNSLPEKPDAIPYVFSYYKRRWGFCLSENHRKALKPGRYRAVIDSDLKPGVMNYADLVLPGRSEREVLLSTYICHPSMANNELSGPVITAALARMLSGMKRRFTYRIVFIPETLGSIVYLSRHLEEMKRKTIAGFVVTCAGDERAYSFLPSRLGNTFADRLARRVLRKNVKYTEYPFTENGSDERQYCSPLVNLPVVSIMRSKYDTYPEYHTSFDNLDLVTAGGLQGAFEIYRRCIAALESAKVYRAVVACEPQLGKRGLYPSLSTADTFAAVKNMMGVLAYADGAHDVADIADILETSVEECAAIAGKLAAAGLLEEVA
jgi:aminopeptidase-like protein